MVFSKSIRNMLVASLFVGVALTGCVEDDADGGDGTDGTDGGPEVTADSFTLATTGVPSTATAGEAFTFSLDVDGEPTVTSDHIGAHYGANSTSDPSTTVYDQACAHTAGEVPGTFDVTCTIAEPGTYFLRGHLRVQQDAETFNYWTPEEFEITVSAQGDGDGPAAPEYTLTATGVPEIVRAGDAFTFTLDVDGNATHESDHIGAHYGATSTNEPSTTAYDKACAHTTGEVPGTFEVTCSIAETGTTYLRGHLRLQVGDATVNYWTEEEHAIRVNPSYTLTATGVPAAAQSGEAFNFTLRIEGAAVRTSDHIGAHYGANSTDEPSTDVYDKACAHTTGEVPGTFTVTCAITGTGTFHLRGHLRIVEDGAQLNYWTGDEFIIVVA